MTHPHPLIFTSNVQNRILRTILSILGGECVIHTIYAPDLVGHVVPAVLDTSDASDASTGTDSARGPGRAMTTWRAKIAGCRPRQFLSNRTTYCPNQSILVGRYPVLTSGTDSARDSEHFEE